MAVTDLFKRWSAYGPLNKRKERYIQSSIFVLSAFFFTNALWCDKIKKNGEGANALKK